MRRAVKLQPLLILLAVFLCLCASVSGTPDDEDALNARIETACETQLTTYGNCLEFSTSRHGTVKWQGFCEAERSAAFACVDREKIAWYAKPSAEQQHQPVHGAGSPSLIQTEADIEAAHVQVVTTTVQVPQDCSAQEDVYAECMERSMQRNTRGLADARSCREAQNILNVCLSSVSTSVHDSVRDSSEMISDVETATPTTERAESVPQEFHQQASATATEEAEQVVCLEEEDVYADCMERSMQHHHRGLADLGACLHLQRELSLCRSGAKTLSRESSEPTAEGAKAGRYSQEDKRDSHEKHTPGAAPREEETSSTAAEPMAARAEGGLEVEDGGGGNDKEGREEGIACQAEEDAYAECMEGTMRHHARGLADPASCRHLQQQLKHCLLRGHSAAAPQPPDAPATPQPAPQPSSAHSIEAGSTASVAESDAVPSGTNLGTNPSIASPSLPPIAEPTLVLAKPLHWEVIPLDGSVLNIVAYVHNLRSWPPASLHAQSLFGDALGDWPLAESCQRLSDTRCRLQIQMDPGAFGKGTFFLGLRLYDRAVGGPSRKTTIGPLSEVRVRLQAPYQAAWSESSCWQGFSPGPPRFESCLRGSAAAVRGRGSEEAADAPDAEAWCSVRAPLPDHDGSPRGGERCVRDREVETPWYPPLACRVPAPGGEVQCECRAHAGGGEALERRGRGAGGGGGAREEGAGRAGALAGVQDGEGGCGKGQGPVGVVVVVRDGAERCLGELLQQPPALPGLNASAASRQLLWVVIAAHPDAAVPLLLRFSPRFLLFPAPARCDLPSARGNAVTEERRNGEGGWITGSECKGLLAEVVGAMGREVETVCGLLASEEEEEEAQAAERGGGGQWACAPKREAGRLLGRLGAVSREEGVEEEEEEPGWVMPRLFGQLGNQLWQVATAFALAADLDLAGLHGRSWSLLLPLPQDPKQCGKTYAASTLSSPLLPRRNLHRLPEQDWHYLREGRCHICFQNLSLAAEVARPGSSLLLKGWWNSYLYVAHHRKTLLKAFSLPAHLEAMARAEFEAMVAGREGLATVSVHVRRGDLLESAKSQKEMLTLEYYAEAIRRLRADGEKLFVIFSDDIDFCKTQPLFRDLPWVHFVEVGVDFVELRLMAMCDHHVIANSTFSYWGAFLHAPPPRRRSRRRKQRRATAPADLTPADPVQEGMAAATEHSAEGASGTVVVRHSPAGEGDWAGVTVVCPAVWGRGEQGEGEGEVSVEELYPPQWVRVPNSFHNAAAA